MGDQYEKYEAFVKKRMWPKAPHPADFKTDAKYAEAVKKFRSASRQAAADRRRLLDAREVPEEIIHELALCKFTVDTYRATYPQVKEMWYQQEDAAVEAVRLWQLAKDRITAELAEDCERIWGEDIPEFYQTELMERLAAEPLYPVVCGKVTWVVDTRFLFCILPSGRRLVYADPSLKRAKTPWGDEHYELRFMGVHKKFKRWERMSTYGGSIVENIDQGTARDMMAYALVTMDESEEYEPIASIHDELVSEADEDDGDENDYERMMVTLPAWADGCPVASEGGKLTRYQK
jgi:DNA polymerase